MLLHPDPHAPLALAERILELLDQGRFTATYKYAVLLALLDLCLENAARDGAAPDLLTTQLALAGAAARRARPAAAAGRRV